MQEVSQSLNAFIQAQMRQDEASAPVTSAVKDAWHYITDDELQTDFQTAIYTTCMSFKKKQTRLNR